MLRISQLPGYNQQNSLDEHSCPSKLASKIHPFIFLKAEKLPTVFPLFLLTHRKLLIPLGGILSKICFPRQQKRMEKTVIGFFRIQSENIKLIWNVRFFVFCLIYNCLIMIALQFCKQYLSYRMVLTLLLLLCNPNNLILELH